MSHRHHSSSSWPVPGQDGFSRIESDLWPRLAPPESLHFQGGCPRQLVHPTAGLLAPCPVQPSTQRRLEQCREHNRLHHSEIQYLEGHCLSGLASLGSYLL